jgi:outer membrane protein assembly factor BamB
MLFDFRTITFFIFICLCVWSCKKDDPPVVQSDKPPFIYIPSLGLGMYAYNAETGQEKWVKELFPLYSSPIVQDGLIYVGSSGGSLLIIDEDSGTIKKDIFIDNFVLSSSPVYSEGIVYIGCNDKLYAIDVPSGTKRWVFSVTGDRTFNFNPAVYNGVVFMGNFGLKGNFYALDSKTGAQRWKYPAITATNATVYENQVFFGGYEQSTPYLYCLEVTTGKLIWKYKFDGAINSSPTIYNGLIYIGSLNGKLYAIDAKSGQKKWEFETAKRIDSSPVAANGIVYFGSTDFYLYALDAAIGIEKWRFNTGGLVYSSPVFFDNKIYQIGGGGTNSSSLFILDAITGKQLVVKELGFNSAGTLATPVISLKGKMVGIYSSESGAVN